MEIILEYFLVKSLEKSSTEFLENSLEESQELFREELLKALLEAFLKELLEPHLNRSQNCVKSFNSSTILFIKNNMNYDLLDNVDYYIINFL